MENRANLSVPKQNNHSWKPILASVVLLAFSSNTFAQETKNSCGYEQDIIAYTKNVIELRPDIETEISSKYGAISAYLYAQYSGLPAHAQYEIYQNMKSLNLQHAFALLGAHRIFTASKADVTSIISEELAKAITSNNGSNFAILRAALLRGQGRYVLKSEQVRAQFIEALGAPHFLSYLVADQDVETRQTLANAFERLGKISSAVAILQTMPTLNPLLDLLQRHKDLAYVDQDIYQGTGGYSAGLEYALLNDYSAQYQNQIIPEGHLYRDPALVNLLKGEQNFRLIQVLVNAFNMTNNLDGLAEFSTLLESAVQSEEFDPNRNVFMALGGYLEYFSELDPEMLEPLTLLKQPYLQYDSTLALARDQSAAFGFSAYINDTQVQPFQPEFLKDNFDFAAWQDTAQVIKQSNPISIQATFQKNPRITAELLFATDRHAQLAGLLQQTNSEFSLAGFSEVFALRLDMRCEGYLNPPLSTMRWNMPIFQFD